MRRLQVGGWRRSEGEWFQKSFLMVGCVGVECEVLVVVFCVEGSDSTGVELGCVRWQGRIVNVLHIVWQQ